MAHAGESKTCKMCCEEIAVGAKKCPFCHHWQLGLSSFTVHPLFGAFFVVVPMGILWILTLVLLGNTFHEGEPFQNYADQITITESKIEFGQDQCGPTVAVIGKMKNSSAVNWKKIRFHVAYFDSKGALVDTIQKEDYFPPRLPAGQELAFKVSFPRQFPEGRYASHKIRIISAVDDSQRSFFFED